MRAKNKGVYTNLFVLLLGGMLCYVIAEYITIRLPHYTAMFFSEATGHLWAWVPDIFYVFIMYILTLLLGQLTEFVHVIMSKKIGVGFAIYLIVNLALQSLFPRIISFPINFLFDISLLVFALFCVVRSAKKINELKPKALSLVLSLLMLVYMIIIFCGDITVYISIRKGVMPNIPANLMVEFMIAFEIITIIYFVKTDPLKIQKADQGTKRMQEIREQYHLTEREADVIALISQGKSNPQIAEMLFISEHTVKRHLTSIYQKTGTGSRYELLVLLWQKEDQE